jgi:hypothetical protein
MSQQDKGSDNMSQQDKECEETAFVHRLYHELDTDFDGWKDLFVDVRDFIYPYLGEFDDDTPNNGYNRHDELMLRTMPIKYANILASGLQWGLTSPARDWVKFTIPDMALMRSPDVKLYLDIASKTCMSLLQRGDFYPENQQRNMEMAVFGTGAMFVSEDNDTGINCHTFTMGEYRIGTNAKGVVDKFGRKLWLKREQLLDMFPDAEESLPFLASSTASSGVGGYYKIYHLIAPNPEKDEDFADKEHMPFREWYWMGGTNGKFLSVGGYHEFPVSVGRWAVKGSDVYGIGPGIWSLGDAKQLQLQFRDINVGVEMGVKPPLQAASDVLSMGGVNLLPGAVNYYNPTGQSDSGIKPIFEGRLDLASATNLASATEECLKEHFHTKVFQLLSDMDKGTRSAQEIIELSAEKMSQMGPLVDRMETEFLPSIINRVFAIAVRKGLLPPPPPGLQGRELQITYDSVLSQAQKQSSITPIVSVVTQGIQMASSTGKPEILDKFDFDEIIDQLADKNGVPPTIIKSEDAVNQIRMARAKQQQLMQVASMAQQSAQAAKTASQADLSSNNALVQVLGGPAGGPSAGGQ